MSQLDAASPRVAENIERHTIDRCNLCGYRETQPFCPQNGRGLVQCQNCGLVYVGQQPDPEELYALYGETYFHNDESGEVGYTNYIKDEKNIRKTVNRRFDHIEKFVQPGKMIDIGCAMGFFIDEASKRGWQVEGMDVSHFAVEYVKERFGHNVYQGSLDTLELEEGAYDLVTMYDVIEHVPDPKAYMMRVASLLRSGGIFELATPDVDSIPAKLTGKRWIGYKLSEEHVYYFSVNTLRQMLDYAGFDVVHVRHIGKYVTLRLFLDRLGFYAPWLSKPLQALERTFKLSERAQYINPFDIVAITARKR
ncbi:class I SAM-dependent methyltransferase [Phototrophicus methaneseepsis]|uniref:Class I SAM-dependent methyltransferase n=1 Tax=Phototrophicus methaneseepsis TaxID=2710758 RepID=A0A7S8ECG8_9CHLR|nr:class I SAM-dependent methyltransferase [Phototrophicus methaneseepsis]QPC84319.1 class I SAM-dependent methyltransferase [Phototrophicus methaneseepsis]